MIVRFRTRREDFPANIESLTIQHVVLYFARTDEGVGEIEVAHLRFTDQGGGEPAGGGATTSGGIISTRRINGRVWHPILGKSPFGEWELALPEVMQERFKEEKIEDILFVLTYEGQTPEWPA
jgi:hypothetical protein